MEEGAHGDSQSHTLSLRRGKASVIFLDFWHILPFQMAHTGPNHLPLRFIPFLFSFFLFCFHAPVSLLLYFSLCICSRHLLFLSAQHLLPNLLIKASEFAFEKPVCPTRSWPRDRQALDINEILAPWNVTSEQSNVKTTLLPAAQIPGVP